MFFWSIHENFNLLRRLSNHNKIIEDELQTYSKTSQKYKELSNRNR